MRLFSSFFPHLRVFRPSSPDLSSIVSRSFVNRLHVFRPPSPRLSSLVPAGVDPDLFTGFPESHQILLKNEHAPCICFYCVYYRFSHWHPRHAKFGGIYRKIQQNERGGFAYFREPSRWKLGNQCFLLKHTETHQNFILLAKTSQAIKVNPSKLYFIGRAP